MKEILQYCWHQFPSGGAILQNGGKISFSATCFPGCGCKETSSVPDNYNVEIDQVPGSALMGSCPACSSNNMQRLQDPDTGTTAGAQCQTCFLTVRAVENFYVLHCGGQESPTTISGPYTKGDAETLVKRDQDTDSDTRTGNAVAVLTEDEAQEHPCWNS